MKATASSILFRVVGRHGCVSLATGATAFTRAASAIALTVLAWLAGLATHPPVAAQTPPDTVFRDCPHCPEMVVVPLGSFLMGSPDTEEGRFEDEGPQREITVRAAFAIGVYEVTVEEWDACVSDGGCRGYHPPDEGWGRGRRPVTNVSWEYGMSFPSCSDGQAEGTAPVGSYEPNAYGLYDVMGNLTEWTDDCWNPDHSERPDNDEVRASGDCSQRALRGGTWGYPSEFLRSANRGSFELGHRDNGLGFRVIRFSR